VDDILKRGEDIEEKAMAAEAGIIALVNEKIR
jgi:hypothetical protein